jgi:hypothetical protein
MKKLLLLLFSISLSSFSQQLPQVDNVNRAVLEYIKKAPIDVYLTKNILIEMNEKIINETNDVSLKKDAMDYFIVLKNTKVVEGIKIDLTKLTKENLNRFHKKEDKFDKSINIYHKKNKSSRFSCSIFIDNDLALLSFGIEYNDYDWLFMNRCIFQINGENYDYKFNDVKREIVSNGINEKDNQFVNTQQYEILEKIIKSSNIVSFRLQGDKGNKDSEIRQNEIELIKETLELIEKIKL